jgi:hypothetical protein
MRLIIPHKKSKQEVIDTIDQTIDDLFKQSGAFPVKIVEKQRSWQGSTLTFALAAKMGIISTPIKGTVDVTDRDITIDVDLGMLERLVPAEKAREMITTRVKGLLK